MFIPQPLNRPFIGIALSRKDYEEVKNALPTPSYQCLQFSYSSTKIVLIYVISGLIKSKKQIDFIKLIKNKLKDKINTNFDYLKTFYISNDSVNNNMVYSLKDLGFAFNIERDNRPFIGMSLLRKDYQKLKGMIPTPSYINTLYSYNKTKIILIYVIDGYITSYSQYFWLSSIKLALSNKVFVPFEFTSEYFITADTTINSILYSLDDLSKAFNTKGIKYIDNIYHPQDKKELYQKLIWHGKKLRYQSILTEDSLMGIALIMNRYLKDKLSNKELQNKVTASYDFINKNIDNFPQKLELKELKEAHKRGANSTHKKQFKTTKARINRALKSNSYIKSNGKVNKTQLAKDLKLDRRTLDKYL